MIGAKYGCEGRGWCSLPVIGPHGVSLWKPISRGWPSFVRLIKFEVGAGFTVRFWRDIWCGNASLCVLYTRLFSLSRNKEAFVTELMKFPNGVLFWDLTFRRYNEDWDLESFCSLMFRIYGASSKGVRDDKICWNPARVKVLLFIPITRCCLIVSISLSLGRLLGSLRSPLELLFLCGLQLWGIF